MNKVENLFNTKAINRGGILLYEKYTALAFIQQCQNEKIAILGVDGFYLTESTTQPTIENSLDISTKMFDSKIDYDLLIKFITERDDDLFFEVVCAD